MRTVKLSKLLVNIFIAVGCGVISILLAGGAGDYKILRLPPLAPPSWIFPVVWTILYILMGTAAYFVSERRGNGRALKIYYIQLALNFLWPIVFFRFDLYWTAASLAVALAFAVLLTVLEFWQIDILAGKLIVPYFIWLLFAVYLSIGVAVLN